MKIPDFKSPRTFEIKHTHASIVLGSYPLSFKVKKAVELGCGNAVSSLLMALSNCQVERIVAVDVDELACKDAKEFVKLNDLSERIEILRSDVIDVPKKLGYESFDFVFFNPPFHLGGKVSSDERRFIERNKDVMEEFIFSSAKVLKNGGYFRVVISPHILLKIFSLLESRRLIPKWIVPIYGKQDGDSKLVLVEGIKNGKMGGFRIKSPIFLDQESI